MFKEWLIRKLNAVPESKYKEVSEQLMSTKAELTEAERKLKANEIPISVVRSYKHFDKVKHVMRIEPEMFRQYPEMIDSYTDQIQYEIVSKLSSYLMEKNFIRFYISEDSGFCIVGEIECAIPDDITPRKQLKELVKNKCEEWGIKYGT